jgi:putative copper export protein
MPVIITNAAAAVGRWLGTTTTRLRLEERGEGVISAAIAVLVFAFLGVLMYTLFQATFTNADDKVNEQIEQIGDPAPAST